jgi:TolB-like protein
MKNRKNILCIIVLVISVFSFMTCTSNPPPPPPPQGPTLDQTIQQTAESIGINLRSGIKIAMLNFTSSSIAFSEYVLDELGGALVNAKRVSVVDRRELELIRQEENFQLSGEVSDKSMVSIGKKLGAQMIVSGSLRNMGEEYKFTARILNVETAQVEAFFSSDISKKDTRTSYLLSVRNPTPAPKPPSPPIGERGPGGGIIFFAESGVLMEISMTLGSYNWNQAMEVARNYRGGGFNDWRLPTTGEAQLIYQNLGKYNLGGFGNDSYWTSSQGNDRAYNFNFGTGYEYYWYKTSNNSVRVIRTFNGSTP